MPDDLFGPLVTGTEVETAARATLQTWMPDYLGWLERKYDRANGSLITPRSWVSANDVDRWPEEQIPSVLLLSTGLANEPARDGANIYRAKFALAVVVIVSARDRAVTDELAKLYTAACRAILLHKPSLGGFATAVEWVDEEYDVLPDRNRRQLAAGRAVFRVEVPAVVRSKAGPSTPSPAPETPLPDEPTVTEPEVDLDPSLDLSWNYASLAARSSTYLRLGSQYDSYRDLQTAN